MRKSLLFLCLLCVIGWSSNTSGWQPDRRLSEVIIAQPFSISKTHTAVSTISGDSITLDIIPGSSFLKKIVIKSNAPTGTVTGAPKVTFAVGSVANTNSAIGGSELDYLMTSTATGSAQSYGLLTAQYDAAKFAATQRSTDYWVTSDSTVYLNYLITGESGTTTVCTGTVFTVYDMLY